MPSRCSRVDHFELVLHSLQPAAAPPRRRTRLQLLPQLWLQVCSAASLLVLLLTPCSKVPSPRRSSPQRASPSSRRRKTRPHHEIAVPKPATIVYELEAEPVA
uniref:Uncharacterized protein n=1 Tax=Arundo donax TaxID=35708 RepID=A0A0A8XUK3_ARUDO